MLNDQTHNSPLMFPFCPNGLSFSDDKSSANDHALSMSAEVNLSSNISPASSMSDISNGCTVVTNSPVSHPTVKKSGRGRKKLLNDHKTVANSSSDVQCTPSKCRLNPNCLNYLGQTLWTEKGNRGLILLPSFFFF